MRRNLTIAGMAAADLAALKPHLEAVELERGEVLTPQGSMVKHVYFPTTAHLANIVTFRDGRSAEVFVMGVEGVSGLAPFLANSACTWSVEVKRTGEACRISSAALRRRVDESPRLRGQFDRLTSDYQSQAALGVACAALHSVPSRLARYLVMLAEREQMMELHFTQEDLARGLGAQRTTVNAAAVQFRRDRAIDYARGKLTILDIDRLRSAACECYSLQ